MKVVVFLFVVLGTLASFSLCRGDLRGLEKGLKYTPEYKACRRDGAGTNECLQRVQGTLVRAVRSNKLLRLCLGTHPRLRTAMAGDLLVSEAARKRCGKRCAKKIGKHITDCVKQAKTARNVDDKLTRSLKSKGIQVDNSVEIHYAQQNERIRKHNDRAERFHAAQRKAMKVWEKRVAEGHNKWADFHRRQAEEWAKAPKAIKWTPHVQRVVDEMVNRRFRQYVKFFVRHYLNGSPYVPLAENLRNKRNTRPVLKNGKRADVQRWFDPLPMGFRPASNPRIDG